MNFEETLIEFGGKADISMILEERLIFLYFYAFGGNAYISLNFEAKLIFL